ncbi:DUF418 domain-containing protein [Amycolatopsis pittospori]|uniref:DUF418 domain-containing protein n=1 Tax=Amycolatopsis pittospori TaxID=2749434 RepID=UPI0015F03670|nr:DUF418 domain-containing protein [Amycolatopsis pittospori]
MTADGATGSGTRLAHVDALRGFALLGILAVNMALFSSGFAFTGIADPTFNSWADDTVEWIIFFLFTMKFYLLFSFLFGYSFTLQMDSAERRGSPFKPAFLRRLAALFVLGIAHAVLLFPGDILATYAILGLILLAVRNIRPRTAMIVACLLIVATTVATVLVGLSGTIATDPASALIEGARSTEALRGNASQVLSEHLKTLPWSLGTLVVQGPLALASFLIGLALGKHRALADPAAHGQVLRMLQWAGLPIGLSGALIFASFGGTHDTLATTVGYATAPLLTAAYVATALRAFSSPRIRILTDFLAAGGRMALTNYLTQSLVCALIFTGLGAGLIGKLRPGTVLLLTLGLFVAQLLVSRLWLRLFRYGPVEWLLRAVTYGSWSPTPAAAQTSKVAT